MTQLEIGRGEWGHGVLSSSQAKDTIDYLVGLQLDNGMFPWYPGGHSDPWNHCEVVIALSLYGEIEACEKGLAWLLNSQNKDGSFCHYYLTNGVEEPRRDLNTTAYVAVAFMSAFAGGLDEATAKEMWPSVAKAIDYVVGLQFENGAFPWAVDPDGYVHQGSMLTGSSSILSSLEAANIVAEEFGEVRQSWLEAETALRHAISARPEIFLDKSEWAMDLYYPSLVGALDPRQARRRLMHCIEDRLVVGWGVKCKSTSKWVTAAETSELAIALAANYLCDDARRVLALTERFRDLDGSYFTGFAYEANKSFPGDERSSYTAAAVLIADSLITLGLGGGLTGMLWAALA